MYFRNVHFCINVKYYNFIYYCIKVDYINLLAFYIQLSLELLWLNIFSKVLSFYSKPEGCESPATYLLLFLQYRATWYCCKNLQLRSRPRESNKPMQVIECWGLWKQVIRMAVVLWNASNIDRVRLLRPHVANMACGFWPWIVSDNYIFKRTLKIANSEVRRD